MALFGVLYAKYSTMMLSCILKCTDNQLIADEILQNTFAKLKLNAISIIQSGSIGLCLIDHVRSATSDFFGLKK